MEDKNNDVVTMDDGAFLDMMLKIEKEAIAEVEKELEENKANAE